MSLTITLPFTVGDPCYYMLDEIIKPDTVKAINISAVEKAADAPAWSDSPYSDPNLRGEPTYIMTDTNLVKIASGWQTVGRIYATEEELTDALLLEGTAPVINSAAQSGGTVVFDIDKCPVDRPFYTLLVATDENFADLVDTVEDIAAEDIEDYVYDPEAPLDSGTYYFRVFPMDAPDLYGDSGAVVIS